MAAYILRRLALMIPTILGIMLISFTIIQFAPGGPVERIIAQLQGHDVGATASPGSRRPQFKTTTGANGAATPLPTLGWCEGNDARGSRRAVAHVHHAARREPRLVEGELGAAADADGGRLVGLEHG